MTKRGAYFRTHYASSKHRQTGYGLGIESKAVYRPGQNWNQGTFKAAPTVAFVRWWVERRQNSELR